jgi:peptidoglycan/xylan/chitin deacetylase (PgdA/CDA1 family)
LDYPYEERHMSIPPNAPVDNRRPDSRLATVSVTFDNLGEAADLERGLWPEDKPLVHHFSVRRMLPRILGILKELGLHATFFVEGINADLHPEALLQIANSGHELGYHGWRHEYWPNLGPSEEARLLERGVHEMHELGVRPCGFRPPGGRLTASSPELLENLDFTYCSPAGLGLGFLGELVVLPFEWQLVDAYYYLPRFGALRKSATGSSEPLSPVRFREMLGSALQGVVRDGGYLTLLFHPFLEEQEHRFEIMRGALEELSDLAEDGVVWCAPCRDVASWVRERPEAFTNGLQLDPTEA